jgi:predicted nucleic acid-binding protein
MTVVVHDASILIDLLECDLVDCWCSLRLTFKTTSLVWREVNRRHQKARLKVFVDQGVLEIEAISSESLTEVLHLRANLSPGTSVEDVSVLFLCLKTGAILLTGDGLLRRNAMERGIEVHGVLWVLDTLIARSAISPQVAADRLETLLERGISRLPMEECKKRLTKWRKT